MAMDTIEEDYKTKEKHGMSLIRIREFWLVHRSCLLGSASVAVTKCQFELTPPPPCAGSIDAKQVEVHANDLNLEGMTTVSVTKCRRTSMPYAAAAVLSGGAPNRPDGDDALNKVNNVSNMLLRSA